MIIENWLIATAPSALYAGVVRRRYRFAGSEIGARLGLVLGRSRWYLIGLAASVPFSAMGLVAAKWTQSFQGSMTGPFAGAAPSLSVLGAALSYAFIATGFPEEILFRGLIAGALFRKFSFWVANALQALAFTVPHLLILFVAPKLWFLMPGVFVMALALGWLRERSGSIGPGVIVHALSNLAGALAAMNWSAH